ncbi:unnamed protein product, partial [Candidula unifasciata]
MSSPLVKPHRVHRDTHIFTLSNGSRNTKMKESNVNQKISIKTLADFKLRAGVKPIRRMDVSDAIEVKHDNAIKVPSYNQETQALAIAANKNLPPHLLLASLLEELCFIYVKDKNKAQHLFKILCERLSKLQVMAPLSHVDEMSGLRYQRRTMLNKLIRAAMRSMEQGPSLLALPETHFSLNVSSPGFMEEDIIEQQTSRYKNEFQELGILGKGGFGSVFKARNYLDGCEYAVKKVRFKHKNTDLELKLLREVKALANLQHTNIVGYNAAWMEYDSPYLTGKVLSSERSPIKGQRTEDSDSDTFDNQDSMSVEFCLSDDHIKSEVGRTFAISVPGGLAMNAKLFSTVHQQDFAPLAGTKNENQNRSSSEDSVVFVDSVQEHEVFQKLSKLDLKNVRVKKGTSRSPMKTKNKHEANYFPKDVKNHKNRETLCCYDKGCNVSTETAKGASTKMFPRGSLRNAHNVDESLLDNSSAILHFHSVDESLLENLSTNPQFHNVDDSLRGDLSTDPKFHNLSDCFLDNSTTDPQFHNEDKSLPGSSSTNPKFHKVLVEHRHSNHNTTGLLTSSDVCRVHRQSDSVGCVADQEIACTSVDNQKSIRNTAQVRYHWCPDFAKFSDQKCQCSGVQLPPDFINICQQAVSSVVIDLKEDCHLHQHQEYTSVAKLDLNSYMPADCQHCVLSTASQTQSLQLNSTLSELLISETGKSHDSEQALSTPFQAAGSSVTLKASVSHSQCKNKVAKVNPDQTAFTKKQLRHSPILLHASSQSQQMNTVPETTHGPNIFMSHTSSIVEPVSEISNTPTRAEKSGNGLAGLRRGPMMRVSFRSDSEEVVESHSNYVFHNSVTLYIQMELCTFTLQEWMAERNSEFHLKGC